MHQTLKGNYSTDKKVSILSKARYPLQDKPKSNFSPHHLFSLADKIPIDIKETSAKNNEVKRAPLQDIENMPIEWVTFKEEKQDKGISFPVYSNTQCGSCVKNSELFADKNTPHCIILSPKKHGSELIAIQSMKMIANSGISEFNKFLKFNPNISSSMVVNLQTNSIK